MPVSFYSPPNVTITKSPSFMISLKKKTNTREQS